MESQSNITEISTPAWIIPVDVLNLVMDMFTLAVGLLFIFIIVFDKLYNTVPMALVTKSCVAELLLGIFLFTTDILTLYYDTHHIYPSNWFCLTIAFVGYAAIGLQNYSYLLQAIYRYILIVYPGRIYYQSMKFQLYLIFIVCGCCILHPTVLLATSQIKFQPDDAICQVPIGLSVVIIFITFFVYLIPVSGIMIIYLKVIKYVHQMSKRATPSNRLFHAKRQLILVRRIVTLVSILIILGIPYLTFIFMSFFNSAPKYHFRIAFTFVSASLVFVMITLFQITEPLKASIMKRISIPVREINVIQPTS